MVRLYKMLRNGKLKFMDYGVRSRADVYVQQGYIVFYPQRKNQRAK